MTHTGALPFVLKRSDDVIAGSEITTTAETVHGLLRLDGDRLKIQWRLSRETSRVGMEIRSDKEYEAVREVVVPLSALAAASVRVSRWIPGRVRFVLIAADLRAFEEVAGEQGLRLDHPAELVLRIRPADRLAAEEFSSELELAIAENSMRRVESTEAPTIGPGDVSGRAVSSLPAALGVRVPKP
jgi:hypothetical protein